MSDDPPKPPKKGSGYGKPPEYAQFKPGKSGNPQGRPKGSRNFSTEIEAELNARVPVNEHGKRKKISKRKVIAKQLVNKGAGGDPKAIGLLLNHDRIREGLPDLMPAVTELTDEKDKLVAESFIERILKMRGVETPSPTSGEQPAEGVPEALPPKPNKENKP